MKHRVAQVLLIIAGVGTLVMPFLTFRPVLHLSFPLPGLSFLIQILIAGACFVGAVIAGRNGRRHKP
jgi:hypothetical protein